MQQEEIWKDIPDYEGLYQVSNFGRVRRLKGIVRMGYNKTRTVSERICKPIQQKSGYLAVGLSKNGIQTLYSVHRLVAKVFIENPDNLPQVNHKDECKTNNVVSNLEWCTQLYNLTYGTRIQRVNQRICRPVRCYTLDGNMVGVFEGITMAVRMLNLPTGAIPKIVNCCKGKKKTAHGYKWEYADSK